MLMAPVAHAAPPTLGPDCGVGAMVSGSKNAGQAVVFGFSDTCTLTFSTPWPKVPSCAATNETNGGSYPRPIGTIVTTTTLIISAAPSSFSDGDTVTYLCVGQ
jgi:hypothetical protein